MRISSKLTMAEYDAHCQRALTIKIPGHAAHAHLRENLAADSLYDYADLNDSGAPHHRGGPVHAEPHLQERDWRGKYALLSDQFYYFGSKPRQLPAHLQRIVKQTQGHYRRTDPAEITAFEQWLEQEGFERNKVYANPQLPVWSKEAQVISNIPILLAPVLPTA